MSWEDTGAVVVGQVPYRRPIVWFTITVWEKRGGDRGLSFVGGWLSSWVMFLG